MKQLLYIGHEYHLKTRSSEFLLKIFEKEYEITSLAVDPHLGSDEVDVSSVSGRHFDLLVCLQVMPSIERIRKSVSFDHAAFFPMADYYYGARPVSHPIWKEYAGFHIISFSKQVYDEVRLAGFDARYIQYFPEMPDKSPPPGNPRGIYFWQRVTDINPWTVRRLFENYPYDELHMHYAIDPGMARVEVPEDVAAKCKVTESAWFDTREQMRECMLSKAIYIAPRDIEGIGMSFLEAMAAGRCVVAIDNTTMNEYIKHGKTGFLYRRGDSMKPLDVRRPEEIVAIQRRTLDYMRAGWERWKAERERIPAMCVAPLRCNPDSLTIGRLPLWIRYWRSFRGVGVAWVHEHTIRLFGIPLITCKRDFCRKACRWEILRIPVCEYVEVPGL